MFGNKFGEFGNGFLATGNERRETASLPWKEHKDFRGVFLKTIVTAADTRNAFTCHLVRIEPGCAIGLHTHPDSVELHEVVAGEGLCLMESVEVPYAPGVMAILPQNAPHEVRAGNRGLCLLAKFVTV